MLPKGLKFIPTPTSVNKALLKEEFECLGRKLHLYGTFGMKSPSLYLIHLRRSLLLALKVKMQLLSLMQLLSRLEEEVMAINTKLSYSSLTKKERLALNSVRYDTSIIIKEADKGPGVLVWNREDYLKEAKKKLGDEETYEELSSDLVIPLINIVKGCLSRVKNIGDIPNETLELFLINKPKLGRLYLLSKIH